MLKLVNQKSFLTAALKLAEQGVKVRDGGPFGAVVVYKGKIIGRGDNTVPHTNDPTAHAEINAIRAACKKLKTFNLSKCELYSTCEPCPMCRAAIYWARLKAVYFAATRKDAAAVGFDDQFFYDILAGKKYSRVPIKQITELRKSAKQTMQTWLQDPKRIKY